jgi:hypothetical protein
MKTMLDARIVATNTARPAVAGPAPVRVDTLLAMTCSSQGVLVIATIKSGVT